MGFDFGLPVLGDAFNGLGNAAQGVGDLIKLLTQLIQWLPLMILVGGIGFVANKVF